MIGVLLLSLYYFYVLKSTACPCQHLELLPSLYTDKASLALYSSLIFRETAASKDRLLRLHRWRYPFTITPCPTEHRPRLNHSVGEH